MENTISSDFIRGHIDTIILKSLFDSCKHAAEISQYIEEKSGFKYVVKQATLYSALKRLEKLKYVRPFWQDSPEGGRRRYFEITNSGKTCAEKNLSEWDYSRNVIDTLVDEKPVIEPQNTPITTPIINIIDSSKQPIKQELQQNIVKPEPILEEKNQKTVENFEPIKQTNAYDEVNYKQILNDIFNKNTVKTEKVELDNQEKQEDIVKENIQVEKQEQPVFDEEIFLKSRKTSKNDFSDLIEMAEQDGYKIRVSTGKTEKIGGKILINKLNLVTNLSIYLLFLIEILLFAVNFGKYNLFNDIIYFPIIGVATILPVVSIIKFACNPLKTINTYNKSHFITSLIIAFNLILVIFAVALLNEVNFSSPTQIALNIIAPILLVFDFLLYFLIKNVLLKTNKFLTK